VPAEPGRVGQQWGEALHPAEDGDVVGLDTTLKQQLLDITVGEVVPQVETDGDHDDVGGNRNPANADRGGRDGRRRSESFTVQACLTGATLSATDPSWESYRIQRCNQQANCPAFSN